MREGDIAAWNLSATEENSERILKWFVRL